MYMYNVPQSAYLQSTYVRYSLFSMGAGRWHWIVGNGHWTVDNLAVVRKRATPPVQGAIAAQENTGA